jgi:hypothetical protein
MVYLFDKMRLDFVFNGKAKLLKGKISSDLVENS